MSGRKALTVGLVLGIGILNGYYVFEPTFREHAQTRTNLDLGQESSTRGNKADPSEPTAKGAMGDGPRNNKTDR
ncbi:hypothetical protein QBC37DRAFT_422038 [Rhypophila decipiens]|uniref:Uncharacterized protein n=1 Tax=Rhypophila decipiens TaxID=261697 RepID=A0AAN6Y9W0_9PEZI|nr:hypothetical protein QBC37DRAFT_422038 [Rhypophila decipiens]